MNTTTFPSNTICYETGCGHLYVTACFDQSNDKLVRVQCVLGKAGGCLACTLTAIQELTNALLGVKYPLDKIALILLDQQCHAPGNGCASCVDAIGKAIQMAAMSAKEDDK